MFKNFINIGDFRKILEKFRQGMFKELMIKVFGTKKKRIEYSWRIIERPPVNYWNIPLIINRMNQLISGDPNIDFRSYIKEKYLNFRNDWVAVSLGCGSGSKEIEWARMGIFKRIDAYDISENRIKQAKIEAKKNGCADIVKFNSADIGQLEMGKSKYDMVILEDSLHHFSPIERILSRLNNALKSSGYLLVKDFVGPSRFQWTQKQVEIANGLLLILPERYKKKWKTNRYKKIIHRPSRLSMILSDPSEAVESEKILPLLNQIFDVIEQKKMGGTILQILFSEIAHNFINEDEETKELLQICFNVEDTLMRLNIIPSDFILAFCKKKTKNNNSRSS